MKLTKKIAIVLLAALMLTASLGLTACSAKEKYTRMTVDINPSVELMLDKDNKVVSATALNDDGSIILAGEALVGKPAEDAVEMIVSISTDTGYIVKGNVSADENTVTVSVSGHTKNAEKLKKAAEQKVNAFFEKHDIAGKVAYVDALRIEGLRELAKNNSVYTEEEIAAMTEDELYKVIAIGRIETAEIASQAMREAYFAAKEYEISFAEREETAKIIEAMGGAYNAVHIVYVTLLNAYSSAIETLDDMRYNTLVSPDSEYQQALANLRDKKAELLKQKNLTASIDVNDQNYAAFSLQLQLSEQAYDTALAAFEALGEKLNSALSSVITSLKVYEAKLVECEQNFSEDITAELKAKAVETEATLNAKKDAFFEKFEAAHADDVRKINDDLKAKKQALIDEING